MDFFEIEKNIKKKDLSSSLIQQFRSGKKFSFSKSNKRTLLKNLEENALNAKFIPTLNYLILGLLYNKKETIDTIRRKGILRHSKYIEQKNIVEPLTKKIISLSDELYLEPSDIFYFNSIINLAHIYKILKQKRQAILSEIIGFKKRRKIKGHSPSLVKTLLAFVDILFLSNYYPTDREEPNSLKFFIKEDIAEAVSFLIFLKQHLLGLDETDALLVDEEYILSKKIDSIVLTACEIKVLKEFEIMIDHFSYECSTERNTIKIKAPFPDFEKSIRIGYIRSDLQTLYDYKESNKAVSLKQICQKLIKHPDLEVVKYTESLDLPRYIIEFPEPVFKFLSDKFLNSKALFSEEIQYLSHIFKEQFLDFKKLEEIKIKENLSIIDFVRIQRLFTFFHYFYEKIYEESKDNPKILLRSLIPTFSKEKIVQFMRGIANEETINDFLEIMTWDPKDKSLFDIQYQPILFAKNAFMIPISILATSNSIRNMFSSEYKYGNPRIFDNGEYDPLSEQLENAFKKRGFETFKRISYSYKTGGEIDFLAYSNEFLFIAECKNSLHPTNIYELRTVYDNLNKANKQLNLTLEALKDSETSKDLSKKVGYDLTNIKVIKTAIVTSNRLFEGLVFWDHPVRNIHSFTNHITTGNLRTEEGYFSLWESETFALNDIENYLRNDFIVYKLFYNAMVPKEMIYQFKGKKVFFETYILNIEKAKQNLNELNLRKVEISD